MFHLSIPCPSWHVDERRAPSKWVWHVQGSGDPFLSYTLHQIHRIWRQIAPTFGLRLEILQMTEHTSACGVSDKEAVAILHCCLGVLGSPERFQAGTQRSSISAPTQL